MNKRQETLLREWVSSILSSNLYLTEVFKLSSGVKTKKGFAEAIMLASGKLLGPYGLAGVTSKTDHYRIRTKDAVPIEDQPNFAREIVATAFDEELADLSVDSRIDPSISKTYTTHRVTQSTDDIEDPGTIAIIFGRTSSGGQRGGGYQYEIDIVNELSSQLTSGEETEVNTDTRGADVRLLVGGKELYIEVKGEGARYGQPTLYYDFTNSSWLVPSRSRSKENAGLIVNILNTSPDKGDIDEWLESVRQAYVDHTGNEMAAYTTQVSPAEYDAIKKSYGIAQSSPKLSIDPARIVEYYRNKGADFIQIKGKGLYTLGPLSNVLPKFSDALANAASTVKVELLTSGGNKVLRSTLDIPDANLRASSVDLDNADDVAMFIDALR